MLRLFAVTMLFFSHSFGCAGGYESCIAKMKATKVVVGNTLHIPISKTKTVIYSKKPVPNAIKEDPFLSLYLINKKSKYFFKLNKYLSPGEAVVDEKMAIEVKVKTAQFGLDRFATLVEPASAPSLLLNSCCFIEGIVTPDGVIAKEYIDKFINSKKIEYGDIGIRLETRDRRCIVVAKDPFFTSVAFELGDEILLFDNKKMPCYRVEQSILFAKKGSTHKIKVKRDSKEMELSAIVGKRYGGGFISDTFLESRGIYLDKSLRVIKLDEKAKSYGIVVADTILGVNQKTTQTEEELKDALSRSDNGLNLLLQRGSFQFFVQIN